MKDMKKLSLVIIIIMSILSVLSIFDFNLKEVKFNLAGVALSIGIVMYFAIEKYGIPENLLDLDEFFTTLKDSKIIVLILLPLLTNIISFIIAKLFVPDFVEHLRSRTSFLSTNQIPLLIIQLLIMAIGEEIAWRGFFQNQLTKFISFLPSLIISSLLFALCHCTKGSLLVVIYDLFFIFINAMLYGFIFKKANNIFTSSIAHFIANLFGIIIIFFL